jgi:hypothetical protein
VLKLRKYAMLYHRWLGVFFSLLFAVWFASGFVLMYWPYPAVNEAARVEKAAPIDREALRLNVDEALAKLQAAHSKVEGMPDRVRVNMLAGRPVYRFHYGRMQHAIYADDGSLVNPLAEPLARQIAAAWTGKAAGEAELIGALTTEDQWTLNKNVRPLRPFYKFVWPTGEEIYVSEVTGEVMQATTRADRLGAWLGAIPHWIYFTPIRSDTASWRVLVIWLSGIGTVMTLLGIIVGLWLYSPSQRYRFPSGPSSIPYSGFKRWHTMLGLVFGLITFTWILSGMFSMNPNQWSPEFGADPQYAKALKGGGWKPGPFAADPPAAALARLSGTVRGLETVRDLELVMFGGQGVYRARSGKDASQLVPAGGQPKDAFSREELLAALASQVPRERIKNVREVREYENYYVDRHGVKPLPVLYLEIAGASADEGTSGHYLDPKSGTIVSSFTTLSRANRWLYHGLHSLDFPFLYKYRPLWDIVVILLLAGGTALSVTSVWIGWKRVEKRIREVLRKKRSSRLSSEVPCAGNPSAAVTSSMASTLQRAAKQ